MYSPHTPKHFLPSNLWLVLVKIPPSIPNPKPQAFPRSPAERSKIKYHLKNLNLKILK